MSNFSMLSWALVLSAGLWSWLNAQENLNPICLTQEGIATHAISILDQGCGENDEHEWSLKCDVSMMQLLHFLLSCWEYGSSYLEQIEQHPNTNNL